MIYHVGSQIDTQDGDGSKRKWDIKKNEHQEGGNLRNVGSQGIGNGLFQIVENQTTLFYTGNDGGKVVVQQDHVSGLFGDVRAGDTHSNTYKSLKLNQLKTTKQIVSLYFLRKF